MGRLDGEHETPHCLLCGGPCKEPFPRSEYRFPDQLPKAGGDEPPAPRTPNRKGRRMLRPEHHAPQGPEDDRMRRPSEDR